MLHTDKEDEESSYRTLSERSKRRVRDHMPEREYFNIRNFNILDIMGDFIDDVV